MKAFVVVVVVVAAAAAAIFIRLVVRRVRVQGGCTYKKNLEYSVRKIILYSKKCTPAARSAAIKKNHTPRARSAL